MQKRSSPTSMSVHHLLSLTTANLLMPLKIIQSINLLRRIMKNHLVKMIWFTDLEMLSKKELILSPFQSPLMRLRTQERIFLTRPSMFVEM
jgi:hypothetical protein